MPTVTTSPASAFTYSCSFVYCRSFRTSATVVLRASCGLGGDGSRGRATREAGSRGGSCGGRTGSRQAACGRAPKSRRRRRRASRNLDRAPRERGGRVGRRAVAALARVGEVLDRLP